MTSDQVEAMVVGSWEDDDAGKRQGGVGNCSSKKTLRINSISDIWAAGGEGEVVKVRDF